MEDRDFEPTPEKSFFIYGRDISKIPCFRNTLLYGITSGIGMGLGYFLLTSKPRGAFNFSITCFTVVTLGYWIQCRYNYSKTKYEMLRMEELLRQNALLEGSAEDPGNIEIREV